MWTFHSIYKPTIWGGRLIADLKGIDPPFSTIGESWEISVIPGSVSVVKSDQDADTDLNSLVARYKSLLLGKSNYKRYGERFPLLVKFIDAAHDLSVQVHPGDLMAEEEGLPNGKTEMWYVIDRKPGARLANSFAAPVKRERYQELVETGEIEQCLRFTDTERGMVFFIPPGRVHAIGGGNLICEIQESCDTTYRIYDYRRRDEEGRLRELHTEKAFRALNFNDCEGENVKPREICEGEKRLVEHPKFSVNLLEFSEPIRRDYSSLDSFVILVAVGGDCILRYSSENLPGSSRLLLREGEAALIPAVADGVMIEPEGSATLLETYIE